VHCASGVSRSATIVIAYIMQEQNLSVDEATSFVRNKRPIISSKFENELVKWEQKLKNK